MTGEGSDTLHLENSTAILLFISLAQGGLCLNILSEAALRF